MFSKTQVQLAVVAKSAFKNEKCFQKRKVLSKTKTNISKNEKFFKFTKCTRRSGEKFFQNYDFRKFF